MSRDYTKYDEMFKSEDVNSQIFLFQELEKMSDKKDPQIIGRLGRMYRDGKGVDKDLEKAICMLRIAALRNISWAKGEYVDCLLKTTNALYHMEAFSYCYSNADDNNPVLECRLAIMYKTGKGISPNINKAVSWMSRAVHYNKGWIPEYIDMLLSTSIEDNHREAYELAKSNADHPRIAFQLALMYKMGKGVEANTELYEQYMNKAAKLGFKKAEQAI